MSSGTNISKIVSTSIHSIFNQELRNSCTEKYHRVMGGYELVSRPCICRMTREIAERFRKLPQLFSADSVGNLPVIIPCRKRLQN